MATNFFMPSDSPELGVIQAALNGMDVIENVLCRMHGLALIAQAAGSVGERRELARQFDQLRRDLDFVAAGTLGIGKASGDCQIFPADYQVAPEAMIAVCEADGNDCWLRLSGLPAFARLQVNDHHWVVADSRGDVALEHLVDDAKLRGPVYESIYALLSGDPVAGRDALGMPTTLSAATLPDLRLYIHGLNNGWAEAFGHVRAIQVSVAETRAALDGLHTTATSFGAYVFRLYQRYGFGDTPANDW